MLISQSLQLLLDFLAFLLGLGLLQSRLQFGQLLVEIFLATGKLFQATEDLAILTLFLFLSTIGLRLLLRLVAILFLVQLQVF